MAYSDSMTITPKWLYLAAGLSVLVSLLAWSVENGAGWPTSAPTAACSAR